MDNRWTSYLAAHGHEQIEILRDPRTGMRVAIGIHSTRRGPAIGGTRLKRYSSMDAALLDVLRLSEAMTFKAALAGLPLGGGKAVLACLDEEDEQSWADATSREARLRAYGGMVDRLGGRFVTAEDVGTSPLDMVRIRESTRYVAGLPLDQHGGGDPAPITTLGVLHGMRAVAEDVLGQDGFKGVSVAIQGLGGIGMRLAEQLLESGAIVMGADVRAEAVNEAVRRGVTIIEPTAIYSTHCDIYAPCAYGGVLNRETIPQLACRAVVGCANNQLGEESDGEELHRRGIVYAVDYVVNAGGLINVAQELEPDGYDEAAVRQKTAMIYDTMKRLLAVARERAISPHQAAREMALEAMQ